MNESHSEQTESETHIIKVDLEIKQAIMQKKKKKGEKKRSPDERHTYKA